jgi:formyl-CoA transferase
VLTIRYKKAFENIIPESYMGRAVKTPSPLEDICVVDLGQVITGPVCATFLADLGADVVKIERPGGEVYRTDRRELNGEPYNPPFELYNRNKRSLCLDLKSDEGYEAAMDLIERADILIQNWPPGVSDRLNLSYEDLQEVNNELIYVHITGYGEEGPDARKPAMDTIVQHMSGFSSLLGYEGDPPIRSQSSLVDFYAGYNATIAALGALRHRDKGNGGQKVTVSMLEAMMHNMDGAFEYHNNLDEELPRGGRNGFFEPGMLYGAAETKDGWICVALLLYSDRIWEGMCELLDQPEILEKPKYQSDAGRMDDADELSELFLDWLEDMPSEDALDQLAEVGIPASEHNTVGEASELPQIESRGVFEEIDHPRFGSLTLTGIPFDLSDTSPEIERHAPLLGEHSREILEDLGYPPSRIEQMEAEGIVDVSTTPPRSSEPISNEESNK